MFAPIVATLSLGGPCVMTFRRFRTRPSRRLVLFFFCSLLFLFLFPAISFSIPCYFFFCSLLFLFLFPAISFSLPCYFFFSSLLILGIQTNPTARALVIPCVD